MNSSDETQGRSRNVIPYEVGQAVNGEPAKTGDEQRGVNW